MTDPKIIIDEDWKAKVQAEKAAAQQPAAQHSEQTPDEPTPADDAVPDDAPMPPPTIESLVGMITTQAISALGLYSESGEKPVVRRNFAKFLIDSLDVLETKTKGNLTDDEARLLSRNLHQLRMVFISSSK